jgi:hypothetical protein
MENNENKISCSNGRLKIIDPNAFGGVNSSSNIPVNLEDLTISVNLSTFKNGRTVLSTDKEGAKTATSVGPVEINFIDGSDINGKKVLTTAYTDLTMLGDDNTTDKAGENLGITSIDIDFNSQQAPLITINFIDVRGSAIFQNEENITKGKNKYATFFQLPYPLFKLTIKGYYGRPVEYCLHMYKFNSKFNSQTGNFEITANFVGFTYAMLSDMLIGYLKAIPYTAKGIANYDDINTKRANNGYAPIMNLNDLMIAIAKLNETIKKLAATDISAAQINDIDAKKDILNGVEDALNNLGGTLDIRNDVTKKYEYIIRPNSLKNVVVQDVTDSFGIDINKKITRFNENSNIKLDESLFKLDIRFDDMKKNQLGTIKTISNDGINTIGTLIYIYIDDNVDDLTDETLFTVWDLTNAYQNIEEARTSLALEQDNSKKNLGDTIRNTIREKLGFDPTVRSIIEIFTTAVEVFMKCIYDVSVEAEADSDGKRKKQLSSVFLSKNSQDLDKNGTYYPWPGYRENKSIDGRDAYTEKYLGAKDVLTTPTNVHEIAFIEDLLNAFIKAAAKTEQATAITNEGETAWIPINPIDTKLFGIETTPYARIGSTGFANNKEIVRLMLIRGMTFLGYNNNKLTQDEITSMAVEEATAILNTVPDEKIKIDLASGDLTNIQVGLSDGIINDKARTIVYEGITLSGKDYRVYGYFTTGGTMLQNIQDYEKIIPIDKGFTGNWASVDGKWAFDGDTNVKILTNYNNTKIAKPDDGGIYIKIFETKDYSKDVQTITVASADTKTTPIKLAGLIKSDVNVTETGFNIYGGLYGIQEFTKMDWSGVDSSLGDLPLKYVFFSEKSHGDPGFRVGLAYRDIKQEIIPSQYDLRVGENVTGFQDSDTENFHTIKRYDNLGWNRRVATELEKNNPNVTYPMIDFILSQYAANGAGTNTRLSLFGSRWYYAQFSSKYPMYSKALLFLNTLPWNDVPFKANEIKNLFNTRAGFISAPKLWVAYVGGLIWRNDTSEPVLLDDGSIVSGGSGANDPIIWTHNNKPLLPVYSYQYNPPNRKQVISYLSTDKGFVDNYQDLPSQILNMPEQAKNEFKKVFFDFVRDKYKSLHNELKIIKQTSSVTTPVFDDDMVSIITFDNAMHAIYQNGTSEYSEDDPIFTNKIVSNLINTDNYIRMNPVNPDDYHGISLELKSDQTRNNGDNPVKHILDMLKEDVIIANTGFNIWTDLNSDLSSNYGIIKVKTEDFNKYFDAMIEVFKGSKYSTSSPGYVNIKKQREQAIFGTTNEDAIKLQLYSTCKNIFDKWLGGVTDPTNLFFRCGSRNPTDNGLRDKYRKGDVLRLIDSFRFVDRAFRDIGDKLYINPTPVNDYLMNSPNTSVYDAVGQLLASNNFNFLPLPTFINYKDPKTLSEMFKTKSYYDAKIEDDICGPSFVCVYNGQTSKHLDMAGSDYPNDGIDFQCGGKEKKEIINVPSDFVGTSNDFEDDVAVFSVNYGQQNQNIFKDITLDQSEFTETDESLKISDDIANKGSENNVSLGGQNIYNVYSVRSYKAEVEMLGNAMIQPMMHFQLNNIPMFHGAYLVTRVKHSIKPNHMLTVFSGVRVRYPKTELLSGTDFYMSLIDSLGVSTASGGGVVGNTRFATASYEEQKPYITYQVLESDSIKYQIKKGDLLANGDSWCMDEVGKFMEELAKRWHTAKLSDPKSSDVLRIRCFGANGGGTVAKHGDTTLHAAGRAVDFRPMCSTKDDVTVTVGSTYYSRTLNKEFITMALKLSDELKDSVTIQNIILNDSELISYFGQSNPGVMISAPGHDNHIHIEFNLPTRVAKDIKSKQPQPEAIITNGVLGSVTTLSVPIPNETQKLKSLGLIGK